MIWLRRCRRSPDGRAWQTSQSTTASGFTTSLVAGIAGMIRGRYEHTTRGRHASDCAVQKTLNSGLVRAGKMRRWAGEVVADALRV